MQQVHNLYKLRFSISNQTLEESIITTEMTSLKMYKCLIKELSNNPSSVKCFLLNT